MFVRARGQAGPCPDPHTHGRPRRAGRGGRMGFGNQPPCTPTFVRSFIHSFTDSPRAPGTARALGPPGAASPEKGVLSCGSPRSLLLGRDAPGSQPKDPMTSWPVEAPQKLLFSPLRGSREMPLSRPRQQRREGSDMGAGGPEPSTRSGRRRTPPAPPEGERGRRGTNSAGGHGHLPGPQPRASHTALGRPGSRLGPPYGHMAQCPGAAVTKSHKLGASNSTVWSLEA